MVHYDESTMTVEEEIKLIENQLEDLVIVMNHGEISYHPFKKWLEERLIELVLLHEIDREAEGGLGD